MVFLQSLPLIVLRLVLNLALSLQVLVFLGRMCISPNIIPNPNFGYKGKFAFMKDCVSKYIKVPCGHCSECVHIRQLSIVQRCSLESQFGYPFYCTLTYNPESLPHLTCSDGRSIRFADLSDVTKMIKRLRKDNAFGRPFRYFAVSELGSKRGRPHFHLIFFVQKQVNDNVYTPINLEHDYFPIVLKYWSRNIGTNRKPVYKPCCTYIRKIICGKVKTTYDFHYIYPSTVDGSTLDVPFYVTKYMLKPSDKAERLRRALKLNLDEDEYKDIWSVVKPRWFSSLNFGFGLYGLQPRKLSRSERLAILKDTDSFRFVKSSISRSRQTSDSPKFFDPESGRSSPLSRYWMSFGDLYTVDDAVFFHYKNPNWREDNVSIDERDISSKLLSAEKHQKQLKLIDEHSENFDLLFE